MTTARTIQLHRTGRIVLPGLLLGSLMVPWSQLRLVAPPAGPFRRGPLLPISSLGAFAKLEMITADLARLGILVLVVGSMLAALTRSTIGARVPRGLATAASLVTLVLVTVVGIVLPNLSRSAYDGFGVGLSATPMCLCACVTALVWAALEVHGALLRSVPRMHELLEEPGVTARQRRRMCRDDVRVFRRTG